MIRVSRAVRFFAAASMVVLGFASGCSESPGGPKPDETGRVDIRVATKSEAIDSDADGYSVAINTQPSKPIKVIDALTIIELPAGSHRLRLEGLAPNCSIEGPSEVSLNVSAGTTATAAFSVSCVSNIGRVRITTVSSGPDAALNAYYVNLPGRSSVRLGANDTITLEDVRVGTTSDVVLGGVPENCTVVGPAPLKMKVEFGLTTDLAFVVDCETGGSIEITGITTGADLDEDGYQTEIKRVGSSTNPKYVFTPANGTATVPRLASGTYELRYSNFLSNCAPVKAPSVVTVATGTVTQVTVEVNCVAAARIVFVRGSDSDAEIYVTKNNQTSEVRITTQPGFDGDPAWSLNGKIVFASDRNGNREIYVMNFDGSNPVRLTNSNGADYRPALSRDGAKIAFVSERDGNAEIYTMNADGSDQVRITENESYDGDPEWSPDGKQIAFRSKREGAGIWIMNQDGSGLRRLTANAFEDWQPAWSPVGNKIVFSRGEAGGKRDIYMMSANGDEQMPVTFGLTNATDPTWSADGSEIAFGFLSDDCHSYYYVGYECVPYLLTYRFGRPGNYYLVGAPSFNPDWRR